MAKIPHSKGARRLLLAVVVISATLACGAVRAESPAPSEGKAFTQQIPGADATFDMLPIPGGTFNFGSPDAEKKRKEDEGPQVQVKVDPFYMGKYEVTWGEYSEFLRNYARLQTAKVAIPENKMVDAITYPTPLYEVEAGPILQAMGRGPKFPAVIMSQFSARQYTKWLSKKTGRFYRLATEAEWEYACRAGTTTAYNFGDDPKALGDDATYIDNSPTKASPDGAYREVGSKKPNAWGLYDMHGNVAEWVLDGYSADWFATLKQKANGGVISVQDAINWPTKQYPRVIRGGSWNSEAEECRSASRLASKAAMNTRDPQIPKSPFWMTEGFYIGFRIVSPMTEPTEAEKTRFWDVDDPTTKRVVFVDKADRLAQELIVPPADGGKK